MRMFTLGLATIFSLSLLSATVSTEGFSSGFLIAKGRARGRAGAKKRPPLKMRLADIGKVYKMRIAFVSSGATTWNAFWKKVRDERGQFEVRMDQQRKGFIDSLRSLDAENHYQSLMDFEKLQSNMLRAFEEDQSSRLQEFMVHRESQLREFGIAQEAERSRLELSSADAWAQMKEALHIEPMSEKELKAREKLIRGKSRKKKRKMKVHKIQ